MLHVISIQPDGKIHATLILFLSPKGKHCYTAWYYFITVESDALYMKNKIGICGFCSLWQLCSNRCSDARCYQSAECNPATKFPILCILHDVLRETRQWGKKKLSSVEQLRSLKSDRLLSGPSLERRDHFWASQWGSPLPCVHGQCLSPIVCFGSFLGIGSVIFNVESSQVMNVAKCGRFGGGEGMG